MRTYFLAVSLIAGLMWAGMPGVALAGGSDDPGEACVDDRPVRWVEGECKHRYSRSSYPAAVAKVKLKSYYGTNVRDIDFKGAGSNDLDGSTQNLKSAVQDGLQLGQFVELVKDSPETDEMCRTIYPTAPCAAITDPDKKDACLQNFRDCRDAWRALRYPRTIGLGSAKPPADSLPEEAPEQRKIFYDIGEVLRAIPVVNGSLAEVLDTVTPFNKTGDQVIALRRFVNPKVPLTFDIDDASTPAQIKAAVNKCIASGDCDPDCDNTPTMLHDDTVKTLSGMANTGAYGGVDAAMQTKYGNLAVTYCKAIQDPGAPSKTRFENAWLAKQAINPCMKNNPADLTGPSIACDPTADAAMVLVWKLQLYNLVLRQISFARGYYSSNFDRCTNYVAQIVPLVSGTEAWQQLEEIKTYFACKILGKSDFAGTEAEADTIAAANAVASMWEDEVVVCAKYCVNFQACPAVGTTWNPAPQTTPAPVMHDPTQSFCKKQADLCACQN